MLNYLFQSKFNKQHNASKLNQRFFDCTLSNRGSSNVFAVPVKFINDD